MSNKKELENAENQPIHCPPIEGLPEIAYR